ncbi:MAG: DUF4270 domain-containing protein [Bacteroidota bacterium]
MKYILPRLGAILLVIVALASCEEEFSNIDTNIIDQNFNTELDESRTVIAYSKKLPGVQSNGLPVYQLGVYNDPVYGKTTANLLTQLTLAPGDVNPTFGDCTVLDSVVLYLPFFSEAELNGEETTYTLDSIYGNDPVNISIYESSFFLRDLDPDTGFEETQNYYSNQGPLFESNLVTGGPNALMYTIDNFVPNNEPYPIVVTQVNEAGEEIEVLQEVPPGIRIKLPVEFFEEKIVANEGSLGLLNNNNFREFFRGIYFKVESTTDDGSSFLFDIADADSNDLNDAGITMYYTFKTLQGDETCEDEGLDEFNGEVEMLFNAIAVNVFEENLPLDINDALTNANTAEGEETLYVRGGEGIITIIELFGEDADGNGVADELEDLRDREWLINEANLIFYVDQDKVTGGSSEPERLIIYDIKNNRRLIDFDIDLTSSNAPVDAITEHLGRLERGSDENGDFYKIKITSHLSDLINRDSLNVPLGLIVSQNVTEQGFQNLENDLLPRPGISIEQVPVSSAVAPQGTVLFGNATTNASKRLKLQIFYTEPE